MSFESVLPYTLTFEGGYVNDPKDAGGETYKGISRRANPDWAGWSIVDASKRASNNISAVGIDAALVNNTILKGLVADLYYKKYYVPVMAFKAPERVIDKMFDTGVNMGPGAAIRLAQSVIGASVDGSIGPKTLASKDIYFNHASVDTFLTSFCKAQENFYRDIIARKPDQAKFLNGWLRRAAWKPT